MRAHEVLLQTLGVIDLSAGEAEEADEFESPEKMRWPLPSCRRYCKVGSSLATVARHDHPL